MAPEAEASSLEADASSLEAERSSLEANAALEAEAEPRDRGRS